MPEDDVSDLRDVVDAINKLCETMKTSYDEYEDCEDQIPEESVEPTELLVEKVETYVAERWSDRGIDIMSTAERIVQPVPETLETNLNDKWSETIEPDVTDNPVPEKVETYVKERYNDTFVEPIASASEKTPQKAKTYVEDRWNDSVAESVVLAPKTAPQAPTVNDIEIDTRNIVTERWSDRSVEDFEHVASDSEQVIEPVACEPISEMYYTASSEVSLLSDIDLQDKAQSEDSDKEKDDRNSVMAGHVAAMRERFESMTRTNTPCPDLIRSVSPSFEVFRNFSTSPDHLE